MVRTMTFLFLLLVVCVELLPAADRVDAQDLGHKLPGLIGLEAGKVPPPGLYLIDRFVSYEADERCAIVEGRSFQLRICSCWDAQMPWVSRIRSSFRAARCRSR